MMWSIKYKFPLILTVVVALFSLASSWVSNHVIMPPFLEKDKLRINANIQRDINSLLDQADNLAATTKDWAIWDDAYQFVQNGNKNFIDSNFVVSTFTDSPVDGFVFLNNREQIVWGRLYDPAMGFTLVEKSPGTKTLQFVDFSIDLTHLPLRDQVYSGIYSSNNQAVLFAISPITNSENTLAPGGTLLAIKRITPALLHYLQQKTESNFTLSPSFGKMPSKEQLDLTQMLAISGQSTRIEKDNSLLAHNVIPTADGGYLLISIEEEKTYFQLARSLLNQIIAWLVIGGIIIFSISVALIRMYVITPILKISHHVKKVSLAEDYTLQLNSTDTDEVGELSHCIDGFVAKLHDNLKQLNKLNTAQENEIKRQKVLEEKLQSANEKLHRLASSDGLTGIANRRIFNECLPVEWRRMQRHHHPISLIMLDIDYFKRFNDGYGHLKGDECLIQIAKVLQNKFKRAADLVARYGGEEFSVVLPDCDGETANRLAEEIVHEIAGLKITHHYSPLGVITCSAGACTAIPCEEANFNELLKQADENLYNAKATGRNQSWFTVLGDVHGAPIPPNLTSQTNNHHLNTPSHHQ